jgi:hypothetical protein
MNFGAKAKLHEHGISAAEAADVIYQGLVAGRVGLRVVR